jgi:hypothetical protein
MVATRTTPATGAVTMAIATGPAPSSQNAAPP